MENLSLIEAIALVRDSGLKVADEDRRGVLVDLSPWTNHHKPPIIELAGRQMIVRTSLLGDDRDHLFKAERWYLSFRHESWEEDQMIGFFWYFPLPQDKQDFIRCVRDMLDHRGVTVADLEVEHGSN